MNTLEHLRWLFSALKRFHRYEVEGIEHIPQTGGALLVVNHSLATYDALLLGVEVLEQTGRMTRGLGDDLIFKVPWLRELASKMGLKPASPANGLDLLTDGALLGVAPGGMLEALRPSDEALELCWKDRKGFVRLALRAQVPILLAGCGAADRIYKVYRNPITEMGYRHFKVPLPLARGIGPTALPRPVRLKHRIAPPLVLPKADPDPEVFNAQVDAIHVKCVAIMEELLKETAEALH